MSDKFLPYLNNALFPWVISSAILLFALLLWLYFRFKHLSPIIKALNKAIESIEQCPAESFCQEFIRIDEKLKQLPLIQHQWFLFKQYLQMEKTENDDIKTIYYNYAPDYFFNTQSLIADKVNLRFYQSAPNLFIQLGLFFTFLGLLTALYAVSGGLMASELAELKLSLQELLKAATFKFLTSLTAILAAIIYGWREKAHWYRMQSRINYFNHLLETRLLPRPNSAIITTPDNDTFSADLDLPLQTRYQISNTEIQHHDNHLENFDNQFLIAINLGFTSVKKEIQRMNTSISVATQRLYKAIHTIAEQTSTENTTINKTNEETTKEKLPSNSAKENSPAKTEQKFSHKEADKINELLNK